MCANLGEQPSVNMMEFQATTVVIREDEKAKAALLSRGVSSLDNVVCVPFSGAHIASQHLGAIFNSLHLFQIKKCAISNCCFLFNTGQLVTSILLKNKERGLLAPCAMTEKAPLTSGDDQSR